jgi:hypothetical protein
VSGGGEYQRSKDKKGKVRKKKEKDERRKMKGER